MSNLLQRIQHYHLLPIVNLLGLSILLSTSLVTFRLFHTNTITYGFLIWNLFLAGVPLLISIILLTSEYLKQHKFLFWGIAGFWFLFFPNAPYIITDLIHLKARPSIPLWFDAILLFSFVWNGLMLGYFSLYFMHNMVKQKTSVQFGWIFTASALVLSGFGVYLGRFLRWNSWDILTNPLGLLADITDRFINPFIHPRTWAITILLSVFLFLGYLIFRQMTRLELDNNLP